MRRPPENHVQYTSVSLRMNSKQMSTYFSKVIKAGERQREFNFRQTSNNDETRYSVDVPDDKGNRVMFSMYKNAEGMWKTSAQLLPLWIHVYTINHAQTMPCMAGAPFLNSFPRQCAQILHILNGSA